MSYLASLMTNLAIKINGKKGSPLTSLADFMLEWDAAAPEEPKKQSVDDMKKVLLQLAARQNKNLKKVQSGIQPKPKETKKEDGRHSNR